MNFKYSGNKFDVCVIGASNIDIHVSSRDLITDVSVPGSIYFTPGGVGLNMANELGKLGLRVLFISSYADDELSEAVFRNISGNGYVDTSLSYMRASETSKYVNIRVNNKEYGINDMNSINELTDVYIFGLINEINECPIVVFDLNVSDSVIDVLLRQVKRKIVCETTSAIKCIKIKGKEQFLHVLKTNYKEACVLAGRNDVPFNELLDYFINNGVNKVYITLGKDGALAAHGTEKIWFQPNTSIEGEVLGAGDAFAGGMIYGEHSNWELGKTLDYAMERSLIKIINNNHTMDKEMDAYKNYYFKGGSIKKWNDLKQRWEI